LNPQRLDLTNDGLGTLADLHALQADHDGLQVRIKRIGRDRHYPLVEAVAVKPEGIFFVANHGFVVNVLRRNVHQCERQSAFRWAYVARRNLVDPLTYVAQEIAAGTLFVFFRSGFGKAPEVLERKLGINGNVSEWQEEDGVGH